MRRIVAINGVSHKQEIVCYCCQCKKEISIDKVTVVDGDEFFKVDPLTRGWKRFILNDMVYYLCPKHTLNIHIVVDGVPYENNKKEL